MIVLVRDCLIGRRYLAIAIALVAIAGSASAQGAGDDRLANTCTSQAPGGPEEKIAACTTLIGQETPGSERLAILYSSRGAAWRQKGDLDRAIADHDKAIQLQPDAALLYFNRAITWQSKEQSTRAMADFSAAIQRAPKFVIAYRGRGDLLYLQADYANAIKDYDAALRLRPRDAIALVKRGLSKWQLGDEQGGKSDLSVAMRLDPVTAVALVSRASASQPIPVAEPPSAPRPSVTYARHENRDLAGGDIETVKNVSIEKCALACSDQSRCQAYTYDRWNRYCFLKSAVGVLSLDPQSTTGIRDGLPTPANAATPISIRRYSSREFPGTIHKTLTRSNLTACEAACDNDQICVAFSYYKNNQSCNLLKSAEEYFANNQVDSGVKRQSR